MKTSLLPSVISQGSSSWGGGGGGNLRDLGGMATRLVVGGGCPVYTFYDRLEYDGASSATEQALLAMWKRTWGARGWSPTVLSTKDTARHPRYEEYRAKFATLPTGTNPLEYEMTCFVRWIAMAHRGGGFMTDYDTLNVGQQAPKDCAVGRRRCRSNNKHVRGHVRG